MPKTKKTQQNRCYDCISVCNARCCTRFESPSSFLAMRSWVAGAGSLWNEQPLVRAGIVFIALRCAKLDSREAAACATVVAATGMLGAGMTGHGSALGAGLTEVGAGLTEIGLGTARHGRDVGKGLESIASALSGVGDGVHGRGSADGVKVSTHAYQKLTLFRSPASSQRHPLGDIFQVRFGLGTGPIPSAKPVASEEHVGSIQRVGGPRTCAECGEWFHLFLCHSCSHGNEERST